MRLVRSLAHPRHILAWPPTAQVDHVLCHRDVLLSLRMSSLPRASRSCVCVRALRNVARLGHRLISRLGCVRALAGLFPLVCGCNSGEPCFCFVLVVVCCAHMFPAGGMLWLHSCLKVRVRGGGVRLLCAGPHPRVFRPEPQPISLLEEHDKGISSGNGTQNFSLGNINLVR